MELLDKLEKYLEKNFKDDKPKHSRLKAAFGLECAPCEEMSINNYIENNINDDKFQKLLFSYIDDKNLKDSDVYNKVHIDRRLFSKIRNDNYHPSKNTVILLGLSLELSENEIVKLLESASYSLPKNNSRDLIIRFCFLEKIYDPIKVNELLDTYNCQLLD